MPGSASNPVRLDPFQRIIEVGWPSYRYTAFGMSVFLTEPEGYDGEIGDFKCTYEWFGDEPNPCPLEEAETIPSGSSRTFEDGYATGIYLRNNPPGSVFLLRGDAWASPSSVEGAVSDAPDVPDTAIASPEAHTVSYRNLEDDSGFADPSGSPVPDIPPLEGDTFYATTTITFEVYGRTIFGELICWIGEGSVQPTGSLGREVTPGTSLVATYDFDVSSATVEYRGQVYRAVGVAKTGPNTFRILCDREAGGDEGSA